MTQNCFHRRNRRRDSVDERQKAPRFMWRFMCYRTTEPKPAPFGAVKAKDLVTTMLSQIEDPLSGAQFCPIAKAVTSPVWTHILSWTRGELPEEQPRCGTIPADTAERVKILEGKLLRSRGVPNEPIRIAAAYELAALPGTAGVSALANAMTHTFESVRRAAAHGLVAASYSMAGKLAVTAAVVPFCKRSHMPAKWVRKNAAFVLGEVADPSESVVSTLAELLETDDSVHVRGTAATAMGQVGRRAIPGSGRAEACLDVVLSSLTREKNRIGQDITQGVGPYDFRATDDSDLCEGASSLVRMLDGTPG